MNPVVVRVFTNFSVGNTSELLGEHVDNLREKQIDVQFNKSGIADLVFVINCVTVPRWVYVRRGGLIKVLQEPIIKNPLTHLFTYFHSRIFDQIYTHQEGLLDKRVTVSLPCNGTHVELACVNPTPENAKSERLSIIASTLQMLPGQRKRKLFVDELLTRRPDLKIHTYGKGRDKELGRKTEGLHRYQYSIAIENSSSANYVTEKFYDCILSGTVPLYFGAPNIGTYFPPDSFITLPINDVDDCCRIIDGLNTSDYIRRVPSLLLARTKIRENYCLAAVIERHVNVLRSETARSHRYVMLLRRDGLILLLQRLLKIFVPKRLLNPFKELISFKTGKQPEF